MILVIDKIVGWKIFQDQIWRYVCWVISNIVMKRMQTLYHAWMQMNWRNWTKTKNLLRDWQRFSILFSLLFVYLTAIRYFAISHCSYKTDRCDIIMLFQKESIPLSLIVINTGETLVNFSGIRCILGFGSFN